jgi:hypothetical protein
MEFDRSRAIDGQNCETLALAAPEFAAVPESPLHSSSVASAPVFSHAGAGTAHARKAAAVQCGKRQREGHAPMQASQRVSAFQCHQPPASIVLCSWRRRFAVAQGVRRREYPGPEVARIWRMSAKLAGADSSENQYRMRRVPRRVELHRLTKHSSAKSRAYFVAYPEQRSPPKPAPPEPATSDHLLVAARRPV